MSIGNIKVIFPMRFFLVLGEHLYSDPCVAIRELIPHLVACCHARNGTEWVLVSWKVRQTQQEKQQGQQRVARTHPAKPGDWWHVQYYPTQDGSPSRAQVERGVIEGQDHIHMGRSQAEQAVLLTWVFSRRKVDFYSTDCHSDTVGAFTCTSKECDLASRIITISNRTHFGAVD